MRGHRQTLPYTTRVWNRAATCYIHPITTPGHDIGSYLQLYIHAWNTRDLYLYPLRTRLLLLLLISKAFIYLDMNTYTDAVVTLLLCPS